MKASNVFSGCLLSLASALLPITAFACTGYAGPGGPCYTGPGGGLYTGPGGGASTGPGGGCYNGPGGGGTDKWNRPSPACN